MVLKSENFEECKNHERQECTEGWTEHKWQKWGIDTWAWHDCRRVLFMVRRCGRCGWAEMKKVER